MSQLFSEYYTAVRQRRAELAKQFPSGDCLVVSKGTVTEVPVPLAATLLVEGTHKLASESQIQEFHEAQRLNRPPISGLDAARAAFVRLIQKGGPQ